VSHYYSRKRRLDPSRPGSFVDQFNDGFCDGVRRYDE
jgi:hypothetical protein